MRTFAALVLLLADASAFAPAARCSAAKGRGLALSAAPTDTVVIRQDFKLAAAFLGAGAALDTVPWVQVSLGPVVTALGALFLIQTIKLRFTFDAKAFELLNGTGDDTGENIVVGGANRWDYNTFVNYEFFPKGWVDQPQGPILVYFKETQTPADQWDVGPGKQANENAPVRGQVHFFPALCDAKQLRAEFERRGCKRLPNLE